MWSGRGLVFAVSLGSPQNRLKQDQTDMGRQTCPIYISWHCCYYDAYSNPYNAEILLDEPWRSNGLFQFEIIIDVFVCSFRFIWIHMLSGYGSTAIIHILIPSGRRSTSKVVKFRRRPSCGRMHALRRRRWACIGPPLGHHFKAEDQWW